MNFLALAMLLAAASPPGVPSVLIVAGVGGEPAYREQFSDWAARLCAAARGNPELPPPRVRILTERLPEEGTEAAGSCQPAGRSTAEVIRAELDAVPEPQAGLFLVLIGHGSATGRGARFHLPGPDISPGELEEMLARFDGAPVTVAHLGSAAGAFLPALSASGRVVLAASRAHEFHATRFPGHFVAAFAGTGDDAAADRNRDNRISVLEAFEFARTATEREYRDAGLLMTEHALLDDDGDGVGSDLPGSADSTDGSLAARIHPFGDPDRNLAAATTPETAEAIRGLVRERDELAARVDTLRAIREEFDEEEYFARLEELLLRIADVEDRIAALREPPG